MYLRSDDSFKLLGIKNPVSPAIEFDGFLVYLSELFLSVLFLFLVNKLILRIS